MKVSSVVDSYSWSN